MPWVYEEPNVLTEMRDGTVVCYVEDEFYRFQFEDREDGWLSFDIRDIKQFHTCEDVTSHEERVRWALRLVNYQLKRPRKTFRQWLDEHNIALRPGEEE